MFESDNDQGPSTACERHFSATHRHSFHAETGGCNQSREKGLTPQEIDPNAYRQSKRRYAPRDTRKRHPGWVKYQFILPKRLVEGLVVLTKMKAEQHAAERTEQPYGFRRRCAKGKSSFVAEAINRLLAENGLSEFCVD